MPWRRGGRSSGSGSVSRACTATCPCGSIRDDLTEAIAVSFTTPEPDIWVGDFVPYVETRLAGLREQTKNRLLVGAREPRGGADGHAFAKASKDLSAALLVESVHGVDYRTAEYSVSSLHIRVPLGDDRL